MRRSKNIAIGLRSDTVIAQGKKGLTFKKFQNGKIVTRKKILEISEKQVKDYKFIGKAQGMNLFHCIYLASRYCAHFKDRVVAYLIVAPSREKYNFAVSFYEKK